MGCTLFESADPILQRMWSSYPTRLTICYEGQMLRVRCEKVGADVLMTVHSIFAVNNGPEGPVALYRCSCGSIGKWPPDRPLASEKTQDPQRPKAEA